MPLPTPVLDDRSWQQIRDELVRRIPVYTPEWTDHNASDPGITLLELVASFGETVLFRFNQIPEATKLAFLRLLRLPLRPPVQARALVQLSTTNRDGVLVERGASALAGRVPFETGTEVLVLPLEGMAVARIAAPEPETADERDYALAALDARGGLRPDETPVYYVTTPFPEDPSAPDARVIDLAQTVDAMLWVAVLRTDDTDIAALGDATINIGVLPDAEVASMDDVLPCPGDGVSGNEPPPVRWQVSTPTVDVTTREPRWLTLAVAGDTTRALTQEGIVRLRLPVDPLAVGLPPLDDPDLAGTGDFPPALDDPQKQAHVLFWLRATRARGQVPLGRMRWVGINATDVRQQRTERPEFLGTGTAQPGQELTLANAPTIPGSLVLEVEDGDRWVQWTEVAGFEGSTEDDRHFVFDAEASTVRFGNLAHGAVPQLGQRIRARSYRTGGGEEGNVAAKAINQLDGGAEHPEYAELRCANPLRARGGARGETIEEALERIPGEFRRHDRAVTASDFRELARMTPGAAVGRAEVLPRFHPPSRRLEVPGVVTVVVWPREDRRHPNAPSPERALLRDVCCWLDSRRLVTTELWVIPPTYRKVAVAVGLAVKNGYGVEAVRRWTEIVIRQYLAPLPPYGPDANGWPLGRRVHGPELEAAALQVEGVEYLEGDIRVAAWNPASARWEPGPVILQPWEVPELHELTVVQGPPLEPGEALGIPVQSPPISPPAPPPALPQPSAPGVTSGLPPVPGRPPVVSVPIPTLREEC